MPADDDLCSAPPAPSVAPHPDPSGAVGQTDGAPASPRARRPYHSPARQRQAEETRGRILAAARTLFAKHGYAGTTLDAIAEQAGVSPKTVVAVFASKRGILVEALNPNTLNGPYTETLARLRAENNPSARVALAAALIRQVYEASATELDLLNSGRAIAPELAEISAAIERRRYAHQERLIAFLQASGTLTQGRPPAELVDECWALTSFDVYRMLVIQGGWEPARYEAWLTALLCQRLLAS